MFRRLFTTFVDHHIPPSQEFIITNNSKITCGFPTNYLESLEWLFAVAPCFPVHGDRIKIIHEPQVFYQTLMEKCESARKRIVLVSLYLGNNHLEEALIQKMHKQLTHNSELIINILLDFTRGTRGEINSKSMLLPLLQQHKNCFLSLYHTPALRGITKRLAPPRWNELLGLQHMKIYLFDDTVVISGANLSNDYFTNRQDRYIVVEDKNLADFYSKFVTKVQEFSLSVEPNDEVKLHRNWKFSPYEGAKYDFVTKAKEQIQEYFRDVFQKQLAVRQTENSDVDTWIFPLVEMGQLGIHHDSVVTKKILSSSVEGSKLKLATGYFNLTQEYMDILTNNCLSHCSILMAHPNANGFQGARGPAGGIPAAYSLIAKKFYDSLVIAGQDHRVNFFEYQRDGWSYHAKGLWYYLPKSNFPNLTLIGSSNFGERSVNRDLETQICIVSSNQNLQTELQAEVDNLHKLGTTAESAISSRPVPKWVKAVVSVFRNFF